MGPQPHDGLGYHPLNVHHTPNCREIARPCIRSSKYLPAGYSDLRSRRYIV